MVGKREFLTFEKTIRFLSLLPNRSAFCRAKLPSNPMTTKNIDCRFTAMEAEYAALSPEEWHYVEFGLEDEIFFGNEYQKPSTKELKELYEKRFGNFCL